MVRIGEYVFLCSVSRFFKCKWFYTDIQNVWFQEVVNLVNLLLEIFICFHELIIIILNFYYFFLF